MGGPRFDLVRWFYPKEHATVLTLMGRTSAGMGLSCFATGLIGPLYYNITFAKAVGIIFGAGFLGSLVSGWLATFGKKNGLRALANSRYTFGYYGAMFMSFLVCILTPTIAP